MVDRESGQTVLTDLHVVKASLAWLMPVPLVPRLLLSSLNTCP